MIYDTWYRHLWKTGSWRVIAFIILGLISFYATDSLVLAGTIASLDWIIKSILYFIHEWAWSKSNLGRRFAPQKEGCVVWLTGLSGSGKTTIADRVAEKLHARLIPVARLDGDVARRTFSSDLGFSPEDRTENCKRAAIVSSYLKENHIVLASFISPKKSMRDYVLNLCGDNAMIVHVHADLKECARRDPKGMYAQIKDGKFKGSPFTGMHPDAPYEEPQPRRWELLGQGEADLTLETQRLSVEACADMIIDMLSTRGFIK